MCKIYMFCCNSEYNSRDHIVNTALVGRCADCLATLSNAVIQWEAGRGEVVLLFISQLASSNVDVQSVHTFRQHASLQHTAR